MRRDRDLNLIWFPLSKSRLETGFRPCAAILFLLVSPMVGGCLIVASRRECTAGCYPASGHYQATKARHYVAMATCLETVTGRVFERRLRKR